MACRPWRCPRRPRSPAGTSLMRRILPPDALGGAARVWATIAGSGSTPPARPSTRKRGPLRSCSTAGSGPEHAGVVAAGRADQRGSLPPAVYLLIDAIDNQRRGVELPCHRDFWLAVQEAPAADPRPCPVQRPPGADSGGRAKLRRPGGDVRRPQLAAALWLRTQPVRLLLVAASRWLRDGLYRRTASPG